METAITLRGTLELMVAGGDRARLSSLVQAMLDGPLEARERSIQQGFARNQRGKEEKEETRRREEERLGNEVEELRRKLEEEEPRPWEAREAAAKESMLPNEPMSIARESPARQDEAIGRIPDFAPGEVR